jgi:ABC-type glycerol-3-phosphate transport system permease component
MVLGLGLLIWSLLPIYNMFLIALDPEEGEIEFTGNIFPPEPSLDAFRVVVTQEDRYLEQFWQQFGNSLYIGLLTMLLTVLIGSLASFAAGRMRLGKGWWLTSAALLTYAIPAALLAIRFSARSTAMDRPTPLGGDRGAVTLAPFAILILRHYAPDPARADDAASIDGRICRSAVLVDLSAVDGAGARGCRDHALVLA